MFKIMRRIGYRPLNGVKRRRLSNNAR